MTITITQAILLLICFQALIFALILLIDKGPKQWSNRLLAIFLLVLGGQMFAIMILDWISIPDFSDRWACVFGFHYGPLLFLYTLSLMYQDFQLRLIHLLHLAPGILLLILAAIGIPLCGQIGWLIYLILIGYVAWTILRLIRYRKVLKATQSLNKSIELKWLQWMILLFTLILCADILDQFFLSMDIYPGISMVHLSLLVLVVSLYVNGIRQPQLFLGIHKIDEGLVEQASLKKGRDFDHNRLQLLSEHLETTHPYLDPYLSLKDLAEQLDIPPRQLSNLINQGLGKNFMTLINEKRIALAQQRLLDPKHQEKTILEIMYEVGFNSKSSFNTLFKKHTGLTPTSYRKKHLA